ncbi:MAG: hypothetical protein L6Q71_00005, partial [Planctomycetes bacterium]|nr:hypothetical protein [Planctomycetota bacterium]
GDDLRFHHSSAAFDCVVHGLLLWNEMDSDKDSGAVIHRVDGLSLRRSVASDRHPNPLCPPKRYDSIRVLKKAIQGEAFSVAGSILGSL